MEVDLSEAIKLIKYLCRFDGQKMSGECRVSAYVENVYVANIMRVIPLEFGASQKHFASFTFGIEQL